MGDHLQFRRRSRRAPLSPLGNALVWGALALIVLSNLMAVSPEIHAAFCPYERAKQEAAAHHELPPPVGG